MANGGGKDGVAGGGGAPRKPRAVRRKWTTRLRGAFLDALSADCNVRAAARRTDVSIDMIYALRRRDEGFAGEWQVAVQRGYEMLETLVLGHLLAGGGPLIPNPDPALPPIDLDMAMRVLAAHHQRAAKGQPAVGRRPTLASREETNAALIRLLDRIERKHGLPLLDPTTLAPGDTAAAA